MCRSNDQTLLDILGNIQHDLQALNLRQASLSLTSQHNHDTLVSNCKEACANQNKIQTAIDELNNLIKEMASRAVTDNSELVNKGEQLASLLLTASNQLNLSVQSLEQKLSLSQTPEILTKISLLASHVESMQRPMRDMTTTNIIGAVDAESLGRLLAKQLKRQMEPMAERLENVESLVVEMANAVIEKTTRDQIFEKDLADSPMNIDDDSISESNQEWQHFRAGRESRPHSSRLFAFSRHWCTRLGCIILCVTTHQTRTYSERLERSFHVSLTYTPPRRLLGWGLRIMYSTGPDPYGFYEICPRLQPIRILPDNNPVWTPFEVDDVARVKEMIHNRELVLTDINENGLNLVQVS